MSLAVDTVSPERPALPLAAARLARGGAGPKAIMRGHLARANSGRAPIDVVAKLRSGCLVIHPARFSMALLIAVRC